MGFNLKIQKQSQFGVAPEPPEIQDTPQEGIEFKQVDDVYTVPAKVLPFFKRKVDQLNKRAVKNKIPGIQYEVLEKKTLPSNAERPKEQVIYLVKVTGSVPRIEGWSFVASIRHGLDDSGQYTNIVSAIPSYEDEIPQKYWKQEPICEHCRTKRRRKDTFLLKNDKTGEFKQCGRNCLADFLRLGSAEDVVRAAEILAINQELALLSGNELDEFGPSSGRKRDYPLLNILALTHKVVSQIGYTPTSRAQDRMTTKGIIFNIVDFPGNNQKFQQFLREIGLSSVETDANDYEIADEALEWVRGISDDEARGNSYLSNLKALSNSAFIDGKFMGLAVSIVSSYLRKRDEIREKQMLEQMREERGDGNPYLGEVNEPVEFHVMITKTKGPFRGGTSMLYMGLTDEYKIVKWWGKPNDPFEEGQKYQVRGVPVSHGIDKYEKTEVTELRDVIVATGETQEELEEPFIGVIEDGKGKMDNFELTLIKAKGPFQSSYNYGYGAPQSYMVYVFQDDYGRKAKWSGPADKYDLNVGAKYMVRAKPKKHDQNDRYEHGPVTVLTYVTKIDELEASQIIADEEKQKVQKLLEKSMPQTYPEMENLKLRYQQKIEQLGGEYPELEQKLQRRIVEVEQAMEEVSFRNYLESAETEKMFPLFVATKLGRPTTDQEAVYLQSFSDVYKNPAKLAELEKGCQTMKSTPNPPEQMQEMCNFFEAILSAAREYEGAMRQVYEKQKEQGRSP